MLDIDQLALIPGYLDILSSRLKDNVESDIRLWPDLNLDRNESW